MRRLLLALGALVLALVAVIGVEVVLLGRREFLPPDPGYEIDELLDPAARAGGDPIELAVLGDSTVAGVGSPTARESLAALVAQRVAERTGRPVHVVGFGVAGGRTASVLSDQLPDVEPGRFDVILVVAGANDATHRTAPGDLERDLRALIHEARARAPHLVLGSTPAFSGTPALPEPIRSFVHWYSGLLRASQRAVAGEAGVPLVDLAATAGPRFEGVPEAFSSDGFHPSPVGYGFWADALAPAVADVLD